MGTGCFDLILDDGLIKEAREWQRPDELMEEETKEDNFGGYTPVI